MTSAGFAKIAFPDSPAMTVKDDIPPNNLPLFLLQIAVVASKPAVKNTVYDCSLALVTFSLNNTSVANGSRAFDGDSIIDCHSCFAGYTSAISGGTSNLRRHFLAVWLMSVDLNLR